MRWSIGAFTNETHLCWRERQCFQIKRFWEGWTSRAGVLVDGTKEQIQKEVRQVLHIMEGHRFLLGADCTLPTEIAYDRIRTAVEAVK